MPIPESRHTAERIPQTTTPSRSLPSASGHARDSVASQATLVSMSLEGASLAGLPAVAQRGDVAAYRPALAALRCGILSCTRT